MDKLIDIPDEIMATLKILAVKSGARDLKAFIADHLKKMAATKQGLSTPTR